MTRFLRLSVALLLVSACGFPRPADVGPPSEPSDAAQDATDAPEQPGTVVHVSNTGDDSNDGLTLPVKTLKHAIGIAAANMQITKIVLASGHYATATGETFPYTVPANVTIVGPAGGGAILTGSKTEPGMIVDAGALQDLELEDFTVAVTATGMARVTNIHIRTNMLAVRAETTAKLTVNNLDITGTVAACATGIALVGAADLAATILATRNLGTTLDAEDQSTISITSANITGDSSCTQTVIVAATSKTFMLSESLIDGGADGIFFAPPANSSQQASITNSILRNVESDALQGSNGVTFRMTGGEISHNGLGGAELFAGSWTFTNVTMKQNSIFAIYQQNGTLVMRGCSVTDNGDGVYLLLPVATDLGTVANPGNNILQNNSFQNLDYDSSRIQVEAVGNTWNPGVQGADNLGRYSPAILQGPITHVAGQNYGMTCDPGQCTLHR